MFRVLASRIIAQNVKIMNVGKYIPSLKMTICQNRQNWPKNLISRSGKKYFLKKDMSSQDVF